MAAVICRSGKQSIRGLGKKLFVGMKTYHVLKNNVPVEISIEDMFFVFYDENQYLKDGEVHLKSSINITNCQF